MRSGCQLGYLSCLLLTLLGPVVAVAAETAVLKPVPTPASIAADAEKTPVSQRPSPDWRDQVIYFVLTDRFADGDPSNNDQGAGEYNPTKSSHYSGGDLAGIQSKLDYIQNLGATAVWLTPPVAHQWWSQKAQYGGYHGYWATNFSKVDPHYGDLASYRALANNLHQRQMYLIQDIVVNHTGNFFGYAGDYDATDTAKNFVLYENQNSKQPAPSQWPFSQINRLTPKDETADIYHWTPPIVDPTIPGQEFRYQLASLADLNTSNPQVRQALKQSYRYWLEQVGVDAFRIDTAKYVEHDFWRDFLHAPDGIFAAATQLGKQHFLAFGEVFAASKPFQNDGEQQLQAFLGTAAEPQLNSVIAFPLYFDINAVLAEGRPPALLGYRLQQHSLFETPHLLPTFINNHDTKRFLAAGSVDAFIQAYALLFTIPGIPVIYQGDEQLLTQTRQAMFQGGWGNSKDQFQTQSAMYQLIQSLAKLRKDYPVFSRGDWSLLQADENAAGVLAYLMSPAASNASNSNQQQSPMVVLMNTADSPRLLAALPTQLTGQSKWQVLWQHGMQLQQVHADKHGRLTLELPARAVLVLQPVAGSAAQQTAQNDLLQLQLTKQLPALPLTKDFELAGKIDQANLPLRLVQNGDFQKFPPLQSDEHGHFSITVPVRDLGQQQYKLRLYAPTLATVSREISYQSKVTQPEWQAAVADPHNDDKGPTGRYQQPQHEHSQQQLDIRSVTAKAGGANLQLEIKMQQISQFWAPANGFDNVHFAIFIHLPNRPDLPKATALPGLNQQMPQGKSWQLGHFMFGWGNSVFNAKDATATETGSKLGAAPQLQVDLVKKVITVNYQGQALGIQDWADAEIYLSTWDKTGEGVLRDLSPQASSWNFGGAATDAPKVLDDLWLKLHKGPAIQP